MEMENFSAKNVLDLEYVPMEKCEGIVMSVMVLVLVFITKEYTIAEYVIKKKNVLTKKKNTGVNNVLQKHFVNMIN